MERGSPGDRHETPGRGVLAVPRVTHKPDKGVAVDIGGVPKGLIEGDDFAKAFLSIWLGPNPPNAGLKAGLLGGPCG